MARTRFGITRLARRGRTTSKGALTLASVVGALVTCATFSVPAHADSSTLLPQVLKPHNADDSGTELEPNHFALGHKLTDDGRWYVSLVLRWKTTDGEDLADTCHEYSKVLDGNGNVLVARDQRLSGCAYGGNWKFKLKDPGPYTYVLDVTPTSGGNFHAELPFTVDP